MDEILQVGLSRGCDFALQSGDLFHELYPSCKCICKTLRLFEKHVFGDKELGFTNYPVEGYDQSYLNFQSGKPSSSRQQESTVSHHLNSWKP